MSDTAIKDAQRRSPAIEYTDPSAGILAIYDLGRAYVGIPTTLAIMIFGSVSKIRQLHDTKNVDDLNKKLKAHGIIGYHGQITYTSLYIPKMAFTKLRYPKSLTNNTSFFWLGWTYHQPIDVGKFYEHPQIENDIKATIKHMLSTLRKNIDKVCDRINTNQQSFCSKQNIW